MGRSISHIATSVDLCATLIPVSNDMLQQAILSVIGVPGALLAGYMVEVPVLGRRGTLAISTRELRDQHQY
jgi:hypothetical protein